MQYGHDGAPDKVRNLSDGDPPVVGSDGFHGPEDRDPDDGDIEGGKGEVSKAELDRREYEAGDQVAGERDRDGPRDLLAGHSVKDVPEGERDDRVTAESL